MNKLRAAPPRRVKPTRIRNGVARVLSKSGICSRSEAVRWVAEGRVSINLKQVSHAEQSVPPGADLRVDNVSIFSVPKIYIALNKPRGLVTSARDEKGRATVFSCLQNLKVPHLSAVGRLDQASEGLLLFTNDTLWADQLTDPRRHVDKVYHVQIEAVADEELLKKIREGVESDGEPLSVKHAELLRQGARTSWLQLTLDQGKNRQIRRLLAACGVTVLRLVRVSIGSLQLGELPKGAWRELTQQEVTMLSPQPSKKYSH